MNDLNRRIADLEARIARFENQWNAADTELEKDRLVKLILSTYETLNKLVDQSRGEHPQQQIELMEEIRTIRNSVEQLNLNNLSIQNSVELLNSNNLSIQNSVELLNSSVEELKSSNLSIKKSLGHVLEMTLDPWENIVSERTEKIIKASDQRKKSICKYYNIPEQCCMVLGKVTKCEIICAHIWPKCTRGHGLELLGLKSDDVNNSRNFLRLHLSIERAFDEKRLCFVQSDMEVLGEKIRLVVLLLDPDLSKETFAYNNQIHSFQELENRSFSHYFIPRKKPFLRLLALHACKAIEKAHSSGWIQGDFAAQRDRALRLARLSLDENQFNSLV